MPKIQIKMIIASGWKKQILGAKTEEVLNYSWRPAAYKNKSKKKQKQKNHTQKQAGLDGCENGASDFYDWNTDAESSANSFRV